MKTADPYDELERIYAIIDAEYDGLPPAHLKPELERLHKVTDELERAKEAAERPAREAAELAAKLERWNAQTVRVAALPVYNRVNGWEIVFDDPNYVVRHPNQSGEEIYRGKLKRCREVAKESPPDP